MSRILLVGMGVPGFVAAKRHAGPGLRSAHFATALARAGHEVLLLSVLADDEAAPTRVESGPTRSDRESAPAKRPSWQAEGVSDAAEAAAIHIEFTTERQLASAAIRARIAHFLPDAVVGVTVYGAALAARLGLDAPLWADAFGDIMAEAQAKAARQSNDWSLVHFWTLFRGVLETADRFSAVSVAQSHALVGQLGLAGRLSFRTAQEELVAVIPCAAGQAVTGGDRGAVRRELHVRDEDFVLLASGGVNTWCDVETLCLGVALAMEADSRIHLVVTGGAIPGHDEASHRALRSLLAEMPASRVHDLGWVDSTRLTGLYAAADLALHIERSLYERRLGAENRVVEWLAHGLACVTTARSEAGAEMVARRFAFACRPGRPGDLARAIGEAAGDAAIVADAGTRGRLWVACEREFSATAVPLLAWCADPCFARDRDGARLLRLGLLSQPQTSVEMLEAYVAQLPVREVLRRGLRWFARRAMSAAGARGDLAGERRQFLSALRSRFRAHGRRW